VWRGQVLAVNPRQFHATPLVVQVFWIDFQQTSVVLQYQASAVVDVDEVLFSLVAA
jgi:hypothetical protein